MEADGTEFLARLVRFKGEKIDRLTIGDQGTAEAAKAAVEAGRFTVVSVETKPLTRNPPPPFTTSTLQQEAARKLGFSASHTMRVAQAPLRGRLDHLHADRRRPDGARGDLGRPPRGRRPLRRRLRARQAAPLRDQGQERAGSA